MLPVIQEFTIFAILTSSPPLPPLLLLYLQSLQPLHSVILFNPKKEFVWQHWHNVAPLLFLSGDPPEKVSKMNDMGATIDFYGLGTAWGCSGSSGGNSEPIWVPSCLDFETSLGPSWSPYLRRASILGLCWIVFIPQTERSCGEVLTCPA